MTPPSSSGLLHVLYSLRAEGCPRLALAMLREQRARGEAGSIAVLTDAFPDLEPEAHALGTPVFVLGWRRRGFAGLYRRTKRLLAALRPRGIVCYTVGPHVAIAMAATRLGIPLVLHLGCAPPRRDRAAFWKILAEMKLGAPFVHAYAACSDFVHRASREAYGLPAERLSTVLNGIPLQAFAVDEPRGQEGAAARPLTVGMVASFESQKDQATLLEAVRVLRDRAVPVRVLLVGDGSLRSAVEARAERLDLKDAVEFAGSVTDVRQHLARMDVFAYSVRDEEGLGIALVEALAAGVPVVASDVPACREVLAGGAWGRLVPAGDVERWAEALSDDLPPPPDGLRDALSRFDISATLDGYEALFARDENHRGS